MIDEKDSFAMIDKIINRLDTDLKKAAAAALLNKNRDEILKMLFVICKEQSARLKEK